MWTFFRTMNSGGINRLPEPYEAVWVELREPEGRAWFEERFGLDPSNVTCSCCGADFYVGFYETEEIPEETLSWLPRLIVTKDQLR
jgi:hypothetical protein